MDNKLIREMIETLLNTLKSDTVLYDALLEEVKIRGLENHPDCPSSEIVQNTKINIDLLIKYLSVLKEELDD